MAERQRGRGGGEGAQTWSLMGGLESPPIRPRRERRVHLPLKRGRKKTQRLALTFFANGSHSSNRRWDQAETGITTEPTVDPARGRRIFLCPPGEGPPEQSDGEEGGPSLEEAFAGRSRRPPLHGRRSICEKWSFHRHASSVPSIAGSWRRHLGLSGVVSQQVGHTVRK